MVEEKKPPFHGSGTEPANFEYNGNKTSSYQPTIIVRAEEALIVVLVLALWIAAIALFFNRWGKIRMLEPYQPKFIQQHKPSCALIDPNIKQNRSYSKFNLTGETCISHQKVLSSRRNSVFIDSSIVAMQCNMPRKVKSAFDLQNLVFSDPALNKYAVKIKVNGDNSRRQSWLAVSSKKTVVESANNNSQQKRDCRTSLNDSTTVTRKSYKCERVQCRLSKESDENESSRRNRKIDDISQLSNISNQRLCSENRHNPNINPDSKQALGTSRKSLCNERRPFSPIHKDLSSDGDESKMRIEDKNKVESLRKNSVFLTNSLESERNLPYSRESSRSGVVDFRRNSMLIINNLTDDFGYNSLARDFPLGGSSLALNTHLSPSCRRNSVLLPCGGDDYKPKINFPYRNSHQHQTCRHIQPQYSYLCQNRL